MTVHPVRADLWLGDTWVNVSDRLQDRSPVTVRRGRDNELSQATPSQIGMVLDNTDGALTPRNPMSPYWPDWARGARCRVWVDGATPALILPGINGSYASTPDTGALDITGTITVVARIDPESWVNTVTFAGASVFSGSIQQLASKWDAPSNMSWLLSLYGPGWLQWDWSSTGAASAGTRSTTKLVASTKPMWVGCTFRPNNGAGGNTIVWWTSSDGVTFTQLSTQTVAGTSSIFSGSAPVELGSYDGGSSSYRGRVLGARVINGELAGTVVANPDFTIQTPGARTFTDSATRIWSLNGTGEIATRTIRGVGQVDEMQPDWPFATPRDHPRHEGVAHVQVTASGMLRRMGQGAKPLNSTLFRKITSLSAADNVVAYWPLEDGSDAVRAASPIPGVVPMNIGGDSTRFASDSTLHASKPLPHIDGLIAFGATVPPYSSTQTRVDVFARIDTPNVTPNGTFIVGIETNGTAARWTFAIDDTNVAVVAQNAAGASVVSSTFASDARMFNTWCLWSFNMTQNGGNVDWVLSIVPIPLGVAFGTSSSFAGTVGTVTHLHNWLTPAPTDDGISYGHMIVSTGTILGWLAGHDTAWIDESAAHRFWRLCIEEGIPVHIFGDNSVAEGGRGDITLSAAMGPQGQSSLVDLLTECAEVDGGIMSEHRTAPALDYRIQGTLYNQDTVVTLDAAQQGVGDVFTPTDDDQRLRNDVTATRINGSSARVTTDPPPEPGDLYDVEVPLNVANDTQLPNQAGWRLHLGTWPAMRYPGLSTSLRTAGQPVARPWATIALGDRVTLDNLPRQHEKTTDLLVEGYTETLSHFDWTADLNASPEGPWEIGVRADDDQGKRDTAGSETALAIDADDVDIAVLVTLGPDWTLAAGDYPIDLNVGGEHVRSTSAVVFGAHVFQSCTRSLNGVVKSHPVGTPVTLWRPTIRAL